MRLKRNTICAGLYVLSVFLAAEIFLPGAPEAAESDISQSVVKVMVTYQSPAYSPPWEMDIPRNTMGSGCIIEGNKIITNAHVVADHTYVEVQKPQDTKKYVADVEAIGHDCDLALLTVKDTSFFEGITPLTFDENVSEQDKVSVYGFPIGGSKISITEGIVSRIDLTQYPYSNTPLLGFQVDAAINPGNSGGPAIKSGKVVGIAMSVMASAENIGYLIPPQVINHFFSDLKDGKVEGFPNAPCTVQGMESPGLRKLTGFPDELSGVYVSGVDSDSSFQGVIKEGDVLLSIDGHDIADDITIKFNEQHRISIDYALTLRQVGDKIKCKIFRDKKLREVELVLKKAQRLIPLILDNRKPPYYVWGGMVFMQLTRNYISLYNQQLPATFERLLLAEDPYRSEERSEFVALYYVYADESTKGYHGWCAMVLSTINGKSINSLKELVDTLEGLREGLVIFEVEADDPYKIVVDAKEMREATARILKRYSIPAASSEEFR